MSEVAKEHKVPNTERMTVERGHRYIFKLVPNSDRAYVIDKGAICDAGTTAGILHNDALHSYHRHWPAALADYERAALLDPTLAAVDFARGKTLLHAGSPGQAKSALDRFLAKHPEHAEALATRARVLVILGERLAATAD